LKIDLVSNSELDNYQVITTTVADWQILILEQFFTLLDADSFYYAPTANQEEILEPDPNEIIIWKEVEFKALCKHWIGEIKANHMLMLLGGFTCRFNIEKAKPYDLSPPMLDPISINNKLTIISSHHKKKIEKLTAPVIKINQGLAFGTGDHPTTQLILKQICSSSIPGKTVLDYGCGSGILGIASLALGAKSCTFIDIEPQALTATKNNLKENNIRNRHVVAFPDHLYDQKFDIILINIIANTIIANSSQLMKLINPNGTIIASGILVSQKKLVIKAFTTLSVSSETSQEDWCQITFAPA
jgi:ribosomal protein L11 methyltransferase